LTYIGTSTNAVLYVYLQASYVCPSGTNQQERTGAMCDSMMKCAPINIHQTAVSKLLMAFVNLSLERKT